MLPDEQDVPLDAAKKVQVDEVTDAAARKPRRGERLLYVSQHSPARIFSVLRVKDERMVEHLHIVKLGRGDALQVAVEGDKHVRAPVRLCAAKPVHPHLYFIIIDGLEQIIERVHLVPVDGIARHARREDERNVRVVLAHALRRGDAVDATFPQLYIHKYDVIHRPIARQKRLRIVETLDLQLFPRLLPVSLQDCRKVFGVPLVVLYDRNRKHIPLPLFTRFRNGNIIPQLRRKRNSNMSFLS